MGPGDDKRAAMLLALAGYVLLSTGDAIVKTIVDEWSPPAVALLRYIFGAAGLAALIGLRHGRAGFVMPRPWLQLGRGMAVGIATTAFFAAVLVMPLADATAISFTAPIWVLLLSALLIGERAPRGAVVAVAVAFAGTLLVLRPNVLAVGWPGLLPLLAALGMASLIMLNRATAGLAPIFTMQLLVAVAALPLLVAATALAALSGDPKLALTWPSWSVVARTLLVAGTATTAHYLIFRATTLASAATVAPTTYIQLIVATTAGYLVFGAVPGPSAWAGFALIILAGAILWQAQRPRDVAIPLSD